MAAASTAFDGILYSKVLERMMLLSYGASASPHIFQVVYAILTLSVHRNVPVKSRPVTRCQNSRSDKYIVEGRVTIGSSHMQRLSQQRL